LWFDTNGASSQQILLKGGVRISAEGN
jgi:hypothetical protein